MISPLPLISAHARQDPSVCDALRSSLSLVAERVALIMTLIHTTRTGTMVTRRMDIDRSEARKVDGRRREGRPR